MSKLADLYNDLLNKRGMYVYGRRYELGNNVIALIKDSLKKDLPGLLDYYASDLIRDGYFSGALEYNINYTNSKLAKDIDTYTPEEYNDFLTCVLGTISPFSITVRDTIIKRTRSGKNVRKVILKVTVAFRNTYYPYKTYTLEEINQELENSAQKIREITQTDFQVEPIKEISAVALAIRVSKFLQSPKIVTGKRNKVLCAYYMFRVLSKMLFILSSRLDLMSCIANKVESLNKEDDVDFSEFLKPDGVIPEEEEFLRKNKL